VDSPAAPARIALDGSSVDVLPGPTEALGKAVSLPGRLTEVTATAEDGTPLRAWLALPHDAAPDTPAPLLLWIHGGPLMSWHAWSWRWNPWLAVAKGYAVLLPDPALSTGYGIEFIRRGWFGWGGKPYTDLLSITDVTVARPDIDAERTAAMGGSFGGYMANWMAGHTDRFSAIVTHASVWAFDQMGPTTDMSDYWFREISPEAADANSPHLSADDITTPTLVIHGAKDYRVPISEGLRLWWDLASRSTAKDGATPHKFLYFPDENHWILTPNHAKLWYATVFAFLAQHVLGKDWERPTLLG
jgi:dipeptidyl aminopeptidase/acylaminoacyl peptidase